MSTKKLNDKDIMNLLIDTAVANGATSADCVLSRSRGVSITRRLGKDENIERYDTFDFLGEKDDYSKCYLPHMDFENGELTEDELEDDQDIKIQNLIKDEELKASIEEVEDEEEQDEI